MTDVERKIRLTQFLREESLRNQVRVRKREEILYGNGREIPFPEEFTSQNALYRNDSYSQNALPASSFFTGLKIRSFVAVLLFVLCIYLDLTGKMILHSQPKEFVRSALNWSTEAKLIDFISTFPYTLSDTP